MPTQISSLSEYRRLLNSRSVVLSNFSADWCKPCQTLGPQLEILERQFPAVLFLQIDVDKAEEVAASQRVRGLPTLTFHVDGQRLEPSTIHGLEPQRVYHTLSNLTRVCDYGPEPVKQKQEPKLEKPPDQPQSNGNATTTMPKIRKRQVMFSDQVQQPAQPQQEQRDRVIEIRDMQHYTDEVSSAAGLVVIDFNASWCLPCRQVAPAFRYLSQRPDYGHVKFLSVDVDRCADLAAAMEIKRLPTFMIGSQGQQRECFEGSDTAYLEERIRYFSIN